MTGLGSQKKSRLHPSSHPLAPPVPSSVRVVFFFSSNFYLLFLFNLPVLPQSSFFLSLFRSLSLGLRHAVVTSSLRDTRQKNTLKTQERNGRSHCAQNFPLKTMTPVSRLHNHLSPLHNPHPPINPDAWDTKSTFRFSKVKLTFLVSSADTQTSQKH